MLITLTNASSSQVDVPVLGQSMDAGEVATITMTEADYDKEAGLKALILAGTLTATFAKEATDGGLPVDTSGIGEVFVIRKVLADGTGSAAQDVAIYAANSPFAMRIIDVTVFVSTAVSASTVTLRTALAAGGTALTDAIATATTGTKRMSLTTTGALAAGSSLVVRKSDGDIVGEILIYCVRT